LLKRLIATAISVVLAWTTVFPAYAAVPVAVGGPTDATTLKRDYPNARVIHVTPEQYPALRDRLMRQGYRPSGLKPVSNYNIAQSEESESPTYLPPSQQTPAPPASPEDECKERERQNDGGEGSFESAIDITNDMMPDGNSDSDSAAVLFIVIGTVVLVIWTLYVVKYFVQSAMGMETCGRWSQLVAASSNIGGGTDQHARFNGLRYMQGFNDGGTDVGISAELGHADILLTEAGSLRLQGLYWLIGPMLRWNMNPGGRPNYFQMEFVAGSTEHPEMGIIAVAKMGFNFAAGKNLRWGLNLGAMNINLHANQGIISDLNQYYFLYGLEFGYRF
jgi:hypothetical protein